MFSRMLSGNNTTGGGGSHDVEINCMNLENPEHALVWAHKQYLSLIWLVLVILCGALLQFWSSRSDYMALVPYTSGCMVIGLLMGVAHSASDCGLGWFSVSIHSWTQINSHVLLYVFLPCLLFADSFTLDMHLVKSTLWQCLILAIVGVVIGTVLTAAVTYFVIGGGPEGRYQFSWEQSFMVGSILSATDPVAVVGLLKSLGASPVLTMQVGSSRGF